MQNNSSDSNLLNLYKQLEELLNGIYQTHRSQLRGEDKEIYEGYITAGEYELATGSLLEALENKSVKLTSEELNQINQLYKLMELPLPSGIQAELGES